MLTFANCSFEGEIVIPDSVVSMDGGTFFRMPNLTSVHFGSGLSSMMGSGTYDFAYCGGITEISFASVAVPDCAVMISNLEGLNTIYVPQDSYLDYVEAFKGFLTRATKILPFDGVGEEFVISDGVLIFYNGDGGEVTIPEGVTAIAAAAFISNEKVTGLRLNEGLESIGDEAFQDCMELAGGLVMPAALKTIGNNAFSGCEGLTGLELNSGLLTIGEFAFEGCADLRGDLIIPDTVTDLGHYAFYDCAGLDGRLHLSESMTEVPYRMFANCSKIIGEVIIPDSVTRIGYGAFYGMSGLTSIRFGSGLAEIEGDFYGCTGVTEVTFASYAPPLGIESSLGDLRNLETVYVPAETYNAYVSVLSRAWLADGVKIVAVGEPLESIEVTSPPSKTIYAIGEALDITGLEVTGHYSDDTSKALDVTIDDVSGFDSTAAAEELVLTVSVGGKSATFTVSVEAGEPPEPPEPSLGSFSVTADKARKLVSVSGTGYAPNQNLQLRAAYNYEPSAADSDYASTVTADADGNLEFTLPADATEGQPWLGGHSYYVSVDGVVESASIYATAAKVHTSVRATMKVKSELALAYTIDGVEYTFESSNQGIARVSADGVVTGVRAGTAVITLRATDGSGLTSTMMISVSM
jgi:hypothetical protein